MTSLNTNEYGAAATLVLHRGQSIKLNGCDPAPSPKPGTSLADKLERARRNAPDRRRGRSH